MNAVTPHTQSAELLRSFHRGLPTERLPVPVLVERLKASRRNVGIHDFNAMAANLAGRPNDEARHGDLMAEAEASVDVLTVAIKAAIDVALEPIGLTFAALTELDL